MYDMNDSIEELCNVTMNLKINRKDRNVCMSLIVRKKRWFDIGEGNNKTKPHIHNKSNRTHTKT